MNIMEKTIDRMVEISRQIDELHAEYSTLEAEIIKRFTEETENSKCKAKEYESESGSVSVAYADKVSVVYDSMLSSIFGAAYSDMVKEEKKYTLSAPAKQLLAAIYKKEYIMLDDDQSIEKAISDLPCDEKSIKVLAKKIKGKSFKTDKANLMRYGGFDEQTASDYAYMISEEANWCNFRDMLRLDGRTSPEKIAEVISCINSAVTVDTSPKVTLKAKD